MRIRSRCPASFNTLRDIAFKKDGWTTAKELTDGQRTVAAIKAEQGKRLTYAEKEGKE